MQGMAQPDDTRAFVIELSGGDFASRPGYAQLRFIMPVVVHGLAPAMTQAMGARRTA
ncbi:hypothetical protein D3C76_1691980 [compost metagenome]